MLGAATRRIARFGPWLFVAVAMATGSFALVAWPVVPDVDRLADENPTTTAFMEAARHPNGAADTIFWTPLADIAPVAVCSMVMSEDRFFSLHRGFDWVQIERALLLPLSGEELMGASTITQQLARNLFLTPDRTLGRKIQEALITRRLEADLEKRRILELYLNVIEWGGDIWGITAAARHYFGKAPADLGLSESVFLSSIAAAPGAAWTGRNLARMRAVQRRVLSGLHESGLVSRRGANTAWRALSSVGASITAGSALRSALADVPAPGGDRAAAPVVDARGGECAARDQLSAMRECRRDPHSSPQCPDPERDEWR